MQNRKNTNSKRPYKNRNYEFYTFKYSFRISTFLKRPPYRGSPWQRRFTLKGERSGFVFPVGGIFHTNARGQNFAVLNTLEKNQLTNAGIKTATPGTI
jgi:hypothetical protein